MTEETPETDPVEGEALRDGLTLKQRRFVNEYLVDGNATQAAIRAGYSEDTARSIASENLTKPAIQRKLAEVQAERLEAIDLSIERVMIDLYRNAQKAWTDGDTATSTAALDKLLKANQSKVAKKVEISGGMNNRSEVELSPESAALFERLSTKL